MPHPPELRGRIWIAVPGSGQLGRGRIELLQRIAETGSISRAARAMQMSYKSAWDAIQAMEAACGASLVETAAGGSHGGGSHLSPAGERLIAVFRELEQAHAACLEKLNARLASRLKF